MPPKLPKLPSLPATGNAVPKAPRLSIPNLSSTVTEPEPVGVTPRKGEPAPEVSWSEFLTQFDWRQGEHITAIGPTGGGKTTMLLQLLNRRDYVSIFEVKLRDSTMRAAIERYGYVVESDWQGAGPEHNRVVLWPRADVDELQARQKEVFTDAIQSALSVGGWCLFFDELSYLTDLLGMGRLIRQAYQIGRSSGISIVSATQRPAFVPLVIYDQATHLFFWRENDERNLKTISGLGGMAADPVRWEVSQLPKHTVLYLNTRLGYMVKTKPEVI